MTKLAFTNNASTSLSAAIDAVTTTIPVVTTLGFPVVSPGVSNYNITLLAVTGAIEICKVTAATGTAFTVARGQEGTTAIAFAVSSTIVDHRVTAATLGKFAQFEESLTPTLGDLFTVDTSNALVKIAPKQATVVATTDPQQDFVVPEVIDLVPDAIHVYLNGVLQLDYSVFNNDTIRFTNTPYPYTGDVVQILYMGLV